MKTIGTEEHYVTDEVVAAWSRLGSAAARTRGPAFRPARWGASARGRGAADRGDGRSRLDVQVICSPRQVSTTPGERGRPAAGRDERPDRRARQGPPRPVPGLRYPRRPRSRRRGTRARARGDQARPRGCSAVRPHRRAQSRPTVTTGRSSRPPRRSAPVVHPPPDPAATGSGCTVSGLRRRDRQCVRHFGIGWTTESGVQFLRLALAGVFDRFPDLRVLLGHWARSSCSTSTGPMGWPCRPSCPRPSRSTSAETCTSQPAASIASATCGGRSRWPASSASCLRPTTVPARPRRWRRALPRDRRARRGGPGAGRRRQLGCARSRDPALTRSAIARRRTPGVQGVQVLAQPQQPRSGFVGVDQHRGAGPSVL